MLSIPTFLLSAVTVFLFIRSKKASELLLYDPEIKRMTRHTLGDFQPVHLVSSDIKNSVLTSPK